MERSGSCLFHESWSCKSALNPSPTNGEGQIRVAEFTLCEAGLLSCWRDGEASRLESMAWLPGTRVGSYEIVDVLGDGGMGKVFRVRHLISDRTEAMKVLLAASSASQEMLDRFTREIRSWAIPCSGTSVYAPRHRAEWVSAGHVTRRQRSLLRRSPINFGVAPGGTQGSWPLSSPEYFP
jgi:hypothetical protein